MYSASVLDPNSIYYHCERHSIAAPFLMYTISVVERRVFLSEANLQPRNLTTRMTDVRRRRARDLASLRRTQVSRGSAHNTRTNMSLPFTFEALNLLSTRLGSLFLVYKTPTYVTLIYAVALH